MVNFRIKNIFTRFAKDGKEKDTTLQKRAKQQASELVKLAEKAGDELIKRQKEKADELVKLAEKAAAFVTQTAKKTEVKLKHDVKNPLGDSMTNHECGSSFPKEYKICPSCGVSNRDIR